MAVIIALHRLMSGGLNHCLEPHLVISHELSTKSEVQKLYNSIMTGHPHVVNGVIIRSLISGCYGDLIPSIIHRFQVC